MQKLDLKGLKCPLPVLRLRRYLRDNVKIGEQVQVETTDPMSQIDIPHYCNEFNQKLLSIETLENSHIFIVEKHSEVITPS